MPQVKKCICPYCDASMEKPFPFCKLCGKKIIFCRICGKPLRKGEKICSLCGEKIQQ